MSQPVFKQCRNCRIIQYMSHYSHFIDTENGATIFVSVFEILAQTISFACYSDTYHLLSYFLFQYVNIEECYLCGYLKIKGLTEDYPTLTTFFDGEIISKKHPFLTRKWEADEDVDKKHWVMKAYQFNFISSNQIKASK